MDTWTHAVLELPPENFWPESIFGTQRQIARWISHDGKDDRRRLPHKARHGVIWVKKHHGRLYEVFFRFERDFRMASDRRAEGPQVA